MSTRVLETVEVETGPSPTHTVLWLHGLGADGHDFEPVVPMLGLPARPAVRFVFPHAPIRPVTINGGQAMRAWYDVRGVGGVRREDEAGVRASAGLVEALIAREAARGVPPGRLVLAGFSQGGAMALHTGLRQREPLAGVLALSCFLPLADTLAAELEPASRAVPVFLAHGIHDPVIPLARADDARARLEACGVAVDWRTWPMGHEVCPEELAAIGAWLARVTAAATGVAAPRS